MGWGEAAFPGNQGGFFCVYMLSPVLGGVLASFAFRGIFKRPGAQNAEKNAVAAAGGRTMKTKLIIAGGFLGAGKTTLLRDLAARLGRGGETVGLVTNDQASELVDTALLSRTGSQIVEVSGSCFCCNFEGFSRALETLRQKGASVIVAEPVGSCTDLSATVVQPVKDKLSAGFEIAPLSVLADPRRLSAILAGGNDGLHPSAAYIAGKQFEEADYIVINKMDLLSPEELEKLRAGTAAAYPRAKVFALSALEGTGVAEWLNELRNDRAAGKTVCPVDYDVYAEGEAVLGWLNATLALKNRAMSCTWSDFLARFMRVLNEKIEGQGAAVGHVKSLVESRENFAIGNITRTGEIVVRGESPLSGEATLVINARAEMPPARLEELTTESLREVCGAETDYTVSSLKCFSPGRPRPSHRYTRAL
jgi:G3E family GTPase